MQLTFVRHRAPRALDDLTPIEQEQLVACGKAYDGSDRTAAECLPDDDDEESGLFGLELWDVEDEHGAVLYNIWVYQVDSGSIFQAGTSTEVGGFIQFGLECADAALRAALAAAHAGHQDWPEGTCLRRMSFEG